VPVAYHSFGGWKRSGFGDLNQYGMDGVRFYTKVKTVTQRWPANTAGGGVSIDQSFVIPTMN
jgi:malonate-semialdehyde dehydrogenase (acetylating)/methylmalonate-semialdehyde dehydrogenase